MLEQDVLDLAGRQVLAAADDHVVEAAARRTGSRRRRGSRRRWSVNQPSSVDAARGRGTRPTPARRAPRSRRVSPAATGRRRRRGSRARRRAAAGRPSRAGRAPRDRRWPNAVAVVVGPEHGDRARAGLGEAVGVDEVDVGQQLQRPLDDRARHRPAAVGEASAATAGRAVGFDTSRMRASIVGTTIAWVTRLGREPLHPPVGVERSAGSTTRRPA